MTILANARLILPDRVMRGAVEIDGDRIARITEGDRVPAGAIDCGGDHLSPGLVELHTDNLERHIQPRPGVDWPHAAAFLAHDGELASVGITTVFDALRVGSIRSDNPAYAPYALPLANEINALSRAGATRISHVLHLRVEICSETLIAEMEAFGPDHGVRLVSLMDHTPGQRQFRDLSRLKEYEQGKYGTSDARFDAQVARLIALGARVGAAHEAAAIGFARRLGAVIEEAVKNGARLDGWDEYFDYAKWQDAFRKCGVDGDFYTVRGYGEDELLPWDTIDVGVTKKFLKLERKRAYESKITPDCRHGCAGCGAERLLREVSCDA